MGVFKRVGLHTLSRRKKYKTIFELIGWIVDCFDGWLNWLVVLFIGLNAVLLVGWLPVGWLDGWLVG